MAKMLISVAAKKLHEIFPEMSLEEIQARIDKELAPYSGEERRVKYSDLLHTAKGFKTSLF